VGSIAVFPELGGKNGRWMSGPRPRAVNLSARQRAILERLARRATSSHRLVRRVRIILAAADGGNNDQIARQFGLVRETVQIWRGRWLAAEPRLAAAEEDGGDPSGAGDHDADLTKHLLAVLDDEPRAGAPATFSAEQWCQIMALACEPPASSGRPVTHWTPAELADEAIKRGIVPSIAARTVGRFLGSGRPQAAPLRLLVA
jgi:putative transposase